MNKIDYNKCMEEIIATLDGRKPRLLLHSCCAPCSTHVLYVLREYFEIGIDFYNPNLDSSKEYEHRLRELSSFIDAFDKNIKIEFSDYCKDDFKDVAKKRATMREGEEACFDCYRLRLEHTARLAVERGYEYFTTSLSISPMKNSQKLNTLGNEVSLNGLIYLSSDFKKKNGYKHSIDLSKEYELYRQDYCGCIFSKQERDGRNYGIK